MTDIEAIAQELIQARKWVRPAKLPRQQNPKLTMDEAYAIQRRMVELLGGVVCGYKIGFGKRDLASPYKDIGFGALVSDMQIAVNDCVDSQKFVQLVSENEIAIIIGEDIKSPVSDIAAFKTKIAGVAGAIEMPDKNYQPFEAMTAYDLFANCAVAGAFIVGKSVPLESLALDTIQVTTTRNNEVVDTGNYHAIPRPPVDSAFWLASELQRRGSYLRRGDVILTGSMGKAIPALPGAYSSAFSGLPPIHFRVV